MVRTGPEPGSTPQRLILVIIDRPDPKTGQLPLLVEHFFLITNWPVEKKSAVDVLEHYRRRGTFEDRLGEFNAAIGPHLSLPKFRENEVLLLLSLLAYNLTSCYGLSWTLAQGPAGI